MMPSLLTTAVAGAESDAGMVMVMNWIDGEAVTVTVGAALAWPWPPAVDATAVVLVASLVRPVGASGWVGCAGSVDCAGCSDCVGRALPPTGLPPTRYFGIGGLAIEVLNPAGRVVCSVNDAGIGLLVAEV